jgi:cytochrome c oxidase assembly protein subunit 11
MHSPEQRRRVRRTIWRLALFVPLMFGFAWFVMPPLYDIACRAFGINGKSLSGAPAAVSATDTTRDVTVEFLANVYQGTPLEFRAPRPYKVGVHPGQHTVVAYIARNLTDRPLWAQAVHSISPGETGKYVNAVECFCFKQQKFAPGEERKLTFAFSVSPQLPPEYSTLSVSYTFFKLTDPPEKKP